MDRAAETIEAMLVPRFSLQWLLLALTGCGVVAFIVSRALAGSSWGIGVSAMVGALAVTFLSYALVFIGAWGLVNLRSRRRRVTSPFAADQKPPQILPPVDPT